MSHTLAGGGLLGASYFGLTREASARPGGHILFYTSSFAFDKAKPVIAQWEKERPVERVGEHKSVLIYKKAA